MSISFDINAEPRHDMGKGASRRLRRAGRVPGIVYGADRDPALISVGHNELVQHLGHEAFYSHILTVDIAGAKEQVVLKDLQRHPSKPFILHLDLLRVSAESQIRVHVPLHFLGEKVSPGIKQGGVVSRGAIDVEISCLPRDLPEFIEVELSTLELGDSVHLSELKLPQGVEIPALSAGPEQDLIVASIGHGGGHGVEEEEGGEVPGEVGEAGEAGEVED